MDKKEKKSLPEPRTYTVEQIAAMLNIGRTTAYQLVKQEEFRIVRIGNAIRVSKKSFDEWLERDRKSTRLNSSHASKSRMPSSA